MPAPVPGLRRALVARRLGTVVRRLAVVAFLLALAGPAAAQTPLPCRTALAPYTGAHPVEAVPSAPYYGLRLMGLGGAYTAVAEGAEGIPTTLASVANRRPDQGGWFDWDVDLSWVIPASYLDVDNDGCGAPSGMRMLALGGLLRFGRLGVGAFYDAVTFGGAAGQPATEVLRPILGAAYAFPGDAFVLGAGLDYVIYTLRRPGVAALQGTGHSLAADVLWRPPGRPFRLGLSVKLPAVARLGAAAGSGAPPAVVRPAEVSLGAAWWVGDGVLNAPLPVTDMARRHPPAITGLLLAADVFVLGDGTVDGKRAAGLEAFEEGRLQPVAQGLRWGLRLGGETVPIPGRLRLRGGLWLEPSRFAGVGPRLHLTGGLDVYLLSILGYRWRASFAFDVAASYLVTSLSLGFW